MWIKRQTYPLDGFGGGMIDSQPAISLDPGQSVSIYNRFVDGRRLLNRPGLSVVNPGGVDPLLVKDQHRLRTLLVFVDPVLGDRTLVAGAYSAMAKLDTATGRFVSLPTLSGLVQPSYAPWFADQVRGVSYWSRPGTGLLRVTPLDAGRAGITAPTQAPTLTDGGAGVLPAGKYQAVVRFRNRATGAISNYGPASNELTIAANHKILVSNVQTSPDYQVDTRDVAFTLADRPGAYYDALEILDNVETGGGAWATSPFTHNKTNDELGDQLYQLHFPPPGGIICSAWWDAAQCLAYSDGKTLFLSETGLPESWGELAFDFNREDGYPIIGLVPRGRELLVAKGNLVGVMTGVDRETYAKDVFAEGYGVASPYSLDVAGGTAFWLANTTGGLTVVRADGASVSPVSTYRVDRFLSQIPESMVPLAFGRVWTRHNLYMLAICRNLQFVTRPIPDTLLFYNYLTNAWSWGSYDPRVFSQVPPVTAANLPKQLVAPVWMGEFSDGAGSTRMYSLFDYTADPGVEYAGFRPTEYAYSMEGTTDAGNLIPWHVWPRAFGPSAPRRQHRPRAIHLTCSPSQGCQVNVRTYRDGHTAGPETDRTFSLPHVDPVLTSVEEPTFKLGSEVAPRSYTLPLSRAARIGTLYEVRVAGDRYLDEVQEGSIEFVETAIRRQAVVVADGTGEAG